MRWNRREFLCAAAATSAARALYPAHVAAAGEAVAGALTLDARGRIHPPASSPLRLGGTRSTPRGEETLRFTNLYLEHTLRDAHSDSAIVRPVLPVSGEFHFARCHPEDWEDGLRKMKACGITLVSTYLFWILHEPEEGSFDWTGRRDLRRFVELCGKLDLEVVLRAGPYAHGEFRNGGLPDWLYAKPFAVRSNDPGYLACVRRLFAQIAEQIRGLRWQEGGPILAIQLENEFMAASSPWEIERTFEQPIEWMTRGSGGAEHMAALKRMALELGLTAPIYTATGWGCPLPAFEFLPLYGGYGFEPWSIDGKTHAQKPSWTFLYRAAQPRLQPDGKETGGPGAGQIPFGHCELGGGMQCFYLDRFVVPADCVQATALTSLGSGSSLLGYYVFHGGSNPADERVSYAEYDVPRIGYGFQAPIREYGQITEAYRALRLLHLFLGSWGGELAAMQTMLPAGAESLLPEETVAVRCALRAGADAGFVFVTNYQDHVRQPERRNLRFRVQLDAGETAFPSADGLALISGESAVFPVGLRFGRVTLAWSTAQLITKIEHDNALHIFLFAPRGVAPELAFVSEELTRCIAEGASVKRTPRHSIVRGPASGFRVQCHAADETLWFHVLSREQALHLSRHRFGTVDRLVFTDADAAEQQDGLLLWSERPEVAARVFPPLVSRVHAPDPILPSTMELRASVQSWRGGVTVERIGDDTLRIAVAAHAFDGVDNLLLRVDYVGDIARVFEHGTLIADHFANGVPWEIGLRQLCAGSGSGELILKVVPRTADSRVILDETVPRPERFAGERVASITSVNVVPLYRFLLALSENA